MVLNEFLLIYVVGIISSSHLWGFLADTQGRKRVILPTLFLSFTFTLLSSLTTNFWLFVVLRFFNGFLWVTLIWLLYKKNSILTVNISACPAHQPPSTRSSASSTRSNIDRAQSWAPRWFSASLASRCRCSPGWSSTRRGSCTFRFSTLSLSHGDCSCWSAACQVLSAVWLLSRCRRAPNLCCRKVDRRRQLQYCSASIGPMLAARLNRWSFRRLSKSWSRLQEGSATNRIAAEQLCTSWKLCGRKRRRYFGRPIWNGPWSHAQCNSAFILRQTVCTCGSRRFWTEWLISWIVIPARTVDCARSCRRWSRMWRMRLR